MRAHSWPWRSTVAAAVMIACTYASACVPADSSPPIGTTDSSVDSDAGGTGSSDDDDATASTTWAQSTGELPETTESSTSSASIATSGSTGDGDDAPECGDGVVNSEDEECDYGTENHDNGECTGQCKYNVCGDQELFEGVEECDLGPANGSPGQCGGCIAGTCEFGPYCGDGHHDEGCGELCDGDESPNGLACSPTCGFQDAKLMFITPGVYKGDLTVYTEHEVEDGIDAADWICHDLAAASGLVAPPSENEEPPQEPQFRAWLSSEAKPVAQRLNSSHTGIYVTRDGTLIAEGWDGLTSGSLLAPITATAEGGEYVLNDLVWTNTRPNGELHQSFLSCLDWTLDDTLKGAIGFSGSVDHWTYIEGEDGFYKCEWEAHLYCVEQ